MTYACAAGDAACLIQSIRAANVNGGEPDTIILAGGTYTLTAVDTVNADGSYGLPSVLGPLEILSSPSQATVQRLSTAPPFGLFHVAPGAQLTVRNLLIAGAGVGTGWNAGVYNHGGTLSSRTASCSNTRGPRWSTPPCPPRACPTA